MTTHHAGGGNAGSGWRYTLHCCSTPDKTQLTGQVRAGRGVVQVLGNLNHGRQPEGLERGAGCPVTGVARGGPGGMCSGRSGLGRTSATVRTPRVKGEETNE